MARVNGQPITLLDIVPLAKPALDRSEDRDKAKPKALREALAQYVERELMLQEAVRRGLKVTDGEIEQAYNRSRMTRPNEDDWVEWLKEQGLSPESFRTELRIQGLVTKLGEDESRTVASVTEEEAEAYYNANIDEFRVDSLRVRHILFGLTPASEKTQRTGQRVAAETLLFRLRRGEPFDVLAKQFSQDPKSRDKGGELPRFARGEADLAFEAAAFALKPGEISDVVETPAGYHIIQLIERQPGGTLPYQAVAPDLKLRLHATKREKVLRELAARLRAQGRVETYL